MHKRLAITGSNELLKDISPFIPDDFINELIPPHRGRDRRAHWSPAQLYRLLLLPLLTPAHSFNMMLTLLPEQRAWRKFAHLPNYIVCRQLPSCMNFVRPQGLALCVA